MKTIKVSSLLLGSIVGLSFIAAGCGGGGGGGSAAIGSTASVESAQKFASNIATAIDGCTQVNVNAAPLFELTGSSVTEQSASPQTRAYSINYSVDGLCGGQLGVSGEHNNGTNTLLYAYNAFCMGIGNKMLSLTGNANVLNKGNPGTFGPVVYEDTVSTAGRMEGSVDDSTRAYPKTFSATLNGFSQKYGSGDKSIDATASTPDAIAIASADIIDNSTGKQYRTSGISASVYIASNIVRVITGSGTFTDPDTGTFTFTGSNASIPLNSDGLPVGVSATVTATATDGTTGIVTLGNGQIKISVGGEVAAQVDCTELINSL